MENLKLPGAWREALFDTALVDFLPGFSVRPLSLMWMASHLQNLGGIRVAFPERGFPPTWPLWPKTLGHLQAADGLVWGSESTSPPRGHIWVRSFLLPCWALPLAGPCVSLHGSFELEMRQLVCGLWLDRQQAGWISASTGPSSEGPWATYEGNGSLKRKTDAPDSRRLVVDYQLLRYYPLRVLCLDGRGFAREGQPLASSLFTREGPRICRCSLIPSGGLPGVLSLTLRLHGPFPVASRAVRAAGTRTTAVQLSMARDAPPPPQGSALEPSANTVGRGHCRGRSCLDGPPALLPGFQISSQLGFLDTNTVSFLHISSFLGGVLRLLSVERKTHLEPEFYNSESDNVCSQHPGGHNNACLNANLAMKCCFWATPLGLSLFVGCKLRCAKMKTLLRCFVVTLKSLSLASMPHIASLKRHMEEKERHKSK